MIFPSLLFFTRSCELSVSACLCVLNVFLTLASCPLPASSKNFRVVFFCDMYVVCF